MKKSTKILLCLLIFIINVLYLFISIKIEFNNSKKLESEYVKYLTKCNKIAKDDIESDTKCRMLAEHYNKNEYYNFYIIFGDIIVNHVNNLGPIMILIIDSAAIIYINKVLKNKYIGNYYIRAPKKKLLISILKESYIYVLPILLAFLISMLYLRLNTNIIVDESIITNWNYHTIKNEYIFIIMYLSQLCLFLLSYVNIGIIVSRKYGNYILSLVMTYLTFLGLEIIDELVLDRVFRVKYSSYLSIANPFCFDDRLGMLSPLVFPLLMFAVTFIIIIILFHNKEKIYLDSEKR